MGISRHFMPQWRETAHEKHPYSSNIHGGPYMRNSARAGHKPGLERSGPRDANTCKRSEFAATPHPQSAQPQAQSPAAQPPAPGQGGTPADPASQPPRIAPGSVIPVELTKTIDAKKAKTGDEVVAKVTQDMKSSAGDVIVAKDTKMVGHVTQAQARTKEQKESEVGITFDKAVNKSGEMKLPMSIQAIIAPVNNTNTNPAGDSGSAPSGPVTGGATATSPMGGRNAPMEGSGPAPSPSAVPNAGTNASSGSSARPPINAKTEGVIGLPNVKLEGNAQNAAQGSVVSSEKNNVKLESGTLLLLRVSQ